MKVLNTYTPNELKSLARLNFHTIVKILDEKGIKPLMTRASGKRIVNFYGPDAYAVAEAIRKEKDAKLSEKQRKDEIRAARLAAGLKIGRGHPLTMPVKKEVLQQKEKKVDTPVSNPAPDNAALLVMRVVKELDRIAAAMERLADAWEARPVCKE